MKIKKILKIIFLNIKNLKLLNFFAINLFVILFILNKCKIINLRKENKKLKKNFMQYTLR